MNNPIFHLFQGVHHYKRRLLALVAVSIFSGAASANIVTIDAGHYSFSYDDSFWGGSTVSQSGNVFSFGNLANSLVSSASASTSNPYGKEVNTFDVRRNAPSIWVTADPGYILSSILTRATGSLSAVSGVDALNTEGSGAATSAAISNRWLLEDGTYRTNSGFVQYSEVRHSDGYLLKFGSAPGDFNVGSGTYFYGLVQSAAGSFTALGEVSSRGKGSSASSYIDEAFFTIQVSPVPEAETWAMFLAGLGVLSVMTRHRRRTLS